MCACESPPAISPPVGPALLEHLDSLYSYALALTRSRTEAEDLVQETCLRALRAEAQLRPASHLKSWLFTILRNLFFNHLRNGSARFEAYSLDTEGTDEAARCDKRAVDPQAALLRQVERQQVQAALALLPAVYREVLVLREWEGLSYSETAQVLGCPIGTVMSRLGRARGILKETLAKSGLLQADL
ncbi:MAG: RNA polymerase sigma factor [Acidobacteriaceae bacterium]|nr:RNA polymerase sigma factor [Acidobacteriaceae bacterium]